MTTSGPLTISIDDGVALLHLDDGKANALSYQVLEQLHEGLDRAEAEAEAVVIAGRPGRFSAGFDLSVMTAGDKPMQDLLLAGAEWILRLYAHPQATVAACSGHALAAGAVTLLACDTRIGVEGDFKIGLNEVDIGLALPEFAVELARDRLAPHHLVRATAQAEIYDPAGAVDAGYLDQLVPAEQVLEAAMDEARRLSELRRGAVRETKSRLRSDTLRRVRGTLTDDIAALTMG